MSSVARSRSLLFVPADRTDRFAKALATEADLVCIDLEDAVAPTARAAARLALVEYLATVNPTAAARRLGVRISSVHSADGLRDILALQELAVPAAFVMLAKTESAAQLAMLAAQLPAWPQIALIESAAGLQQAANIGQAAAQNSHAQLQALMLGGVDMSVDLGCTLAWEPLLHARSTLVAAAALAQIGCMDVPWLDIQDSEGARAEAARVAALGFSGKALIHPSQVGPVHAGLTPDEAALQRARRIVQHAGANDSAVQLDGRLIDRPVVLAAQRLLRRAGE